MDMEESPIAETLQPISCASLNLTYYERTSQASAPKWLARKYFHIQLAQTLNLGASKTALLDRELRNLVRRLYQVDDTYH